MGKVRIFTMDAKDALDKGICGEKILDQVGDFFSDIWNRAFNSPELAEDLSNLQEYLKDIADMNNYTENELANIFSNVQELDFYYKYMMDNIHEDFQNYGAVLRTLAKSIGDPQFAVRFSVEGLKAKVEKEYTALKGVGWRTILSKNPAEITDEEYAVIAAYLIRHGDETLLQSALIECYEYDRTESTNNGCGVTSVRVVHHPTEKGQKLLDAVTDEMNVCLTLEQQGLLSEDRMDILNNSVQYATLIHSILTVGEIEIASRSSTLTEDVDVQQEKLIEIHRTGTGDLVADVVSPGTTGEAVDYTLENPKCITVSPLTRGESAEKLASNTAWNYVNAYAGGNAWKAMGQETLSQIMETGLGYVPGWDEVNAVAGILEAGVNAELTDSAIADCRQIDRLSDVMSQFDLYYIQTDIDGSLDSYAAFMYPGADTEKRIQELNESIKANELCVSDLVVAGLPTELDLAYIMNHPDEVVEIMDIMVKSGWADPYAMDAFASVENQEEEK